MQKIRDAHANARPAAEVLDLEEHREQKVTAKSIPFSEDDIALRFSERHADNFRHVLSLIRESAAVRAEKEGHNELAAELRALEFRHLRHTAITRLAEAEVDTKLIAAITGHKLKSCEAIIDRYLIRTEKMARTAFAKRLDAEKENENGP